MKVTAPPGARMKIRMPFCKRCGSIVHRVGTFGSQEETIQCLQCGRVLSEGDWELRDVPYVEAE